MSASAIKTALAAYLATKKTSITGLKRITNVQRKDAYTTANLPALIVGEPTLAASVAWCNDRLNTYRVALWLVVDAGIKPENQEAANATLHAMATKVVEVMANGGWGGSTTVNDGLATYEVGETEATGNNMMRLAVTVEVGELQTVAP
jgi:hypothetical protein